MQYKNAESILSELIDIHTSLQNQPNFSVRKISKSFVQTGRLDAEYYQPKYEAIVKKLNTRETVYTFKDIPPDKSDCLIIGLKISRNRGTKWQFVISGFARFFGKYYEEYNGNVQFQCNISGILESSTEHVKENPTESEQDYLSWLLREINVALTHSIVEAFRLHYENNAYGKRLLVKIGDLEKRIISLVWQIFILFCLTR